MLEGSNKDTGTVTKTTTDQPYKASRPYFTFLNLLYLIILVLILYFIIRLFYELLKKDLSSKELDEMMDTFLKKWLQDNINPYVWTCLGVANAFGLSVLGAAWGIWSTGASLIGASVAAPRITSKNLISILFCEAVAIYGLIHSIVLSAKLSYIPSSTPFTLENYITGYAVFWAGLTVGVVGGVCGVTVGEIGAMAALADAQDKTLFVKILVVEIFASAVGIFGLIVGFIQASKAPSFS